MNLSCNSVSRIFVVFTLVFSCFSDLSSQQPINCGDILIGETNAGTDNLDGYPCRPFSFSGPEKVYTITVADDQLVTIDMTNRSSNVDMFILTDINDPTSCISWSFTTLQFYATAGIEYFLVVDGFSGSVGTYDLEVSCSGLPAIGCGDILVGETNAGTNNLDGYPCRPFSFSGPEKVYTITVADDQLVTIDMTNRIGNVDMFILTDINDPTSCVAWSFTTLGFIASAGIEYFLVVDGFSGDVGTYDLEVSCDGEYCITSNTLFVENLVSYWDFDGDVDDSFGTNDGTIVGTGFSYVGSQFGSGIDLDGVNTYVNAGNNASLDMTSKSVTISAWFRVDAFTDTWQALVGKGEGNNFRLHRFGNSDVMAYSGGSPDLTSGKNVNDGVFHHIVAVTIAGVGKTIYIDGVNYGFDFGSTDIVDSGNPLLIGNNPDILTRDWNGVIDDVAIWDRALCDDEILELYNSGLSLGELIELQPAIPTLSQWGLMMLSLILLIFGTVSIKEMTRQKQLI